MSTYKLARVLGTTIRVRPTFAVAMAAMALSLGWLVLPEWHPWWTPLGSGFVALAITACCVGSIAIHELMHALVAGVEGARVRSVALTLLGGVSNVEQRPTSARAEVVSALAGPAMAISMGVSICAGYAVAWPVDDLPPLRELDAAQTVWLFTGWFNVYVGLLALLPGLPLDGGRLVRVTAWAVTGDKETATRWACLGGELTGAAILGLGLLTALGFEPTVLGSGLTAGSWLCLAGSMLAWEASQIRRQLAREHVLDAVNVDAIMSRDVPEVPMGASVADVVATVLERPGRSCVVVQDRGTPVGLANIQDMGRVQPGDRDHVQVGQVLRPLTAMLVATPEDGAGDALQALEDRGLDEGAVVKDGRVVGLLRARDLSTWLDLQPTQEESAIQHTRLPERTPVA